MAHKLIYLCGGLSGHTKAEFTVWRNIATRLLLPHKTIFPKIYDMPVDNPKLMAAKIVHEDKSDIVRSDLVLMLYDRPSVGSSMEVLFAWEQRVPVHVVNISGQVLSPWLLYHLTMEHKNLAKACRLIRKL